MTRLQARQILRDHGMTLTRDYDEEGTVYIVNYENGEPWEAYVTRDLLDAVDEGVAMAMVVIAEEPYGA